MGRKKKQLQQSPLKTCSQVIVSAWVLIPLANHNPAFFFCPPGTEKLNKYPRYTNSPDDSNVSHMLDNNTLRTAYKHVLIPSYVIQVI